ncbi:hypothetical protein GWK47_018238 [Chionoecetes opilio]|uniref:Uncharacterized protein n=1 Tax=Chionoecetes opilio TaxID=41210 RepID=A0A8J4XQL4_CHIOP|nr:hypothetical protein GWK47_018238 [Chionoecetes opilio]
MRSHTGSRDEGGMFWPSSMEEEVHGARIPGLSEAIKTAGVKERMGAVALRPYFKMRRTSPCPKGKTSFSPGEKHPGWYTCGPRGCSPREPSSGHPEDHATQGRSRLLGPGLSGVKQRGANVRYAYHGPPPAPQNPFPNPPQLPFQQVVGIYFKWTATPYRRRDRVSDAPNGAPVRATRHPHMVSDDGFKRFGIPQGRRAMGGRTSPGIRGFSPTPGVCGWVSQHISPPSQRAPQKGGSQVFAQKVARGKLGPERLPGHRRRCMGPHAVLKTPPQGSPTSPAQLITGVAAGRLPWPLAL